MNKKFISKITSGILLCTMVAYGAPVMAYTKDETVYSKLDSDGSSYNTIVNSHLKNNEENEVIKDLTDLLNIKNTNGDETFNLEGSTLLWNTEGKDIYYQGESSKELPVTCTVKYELDGTEISSKDLAGKNGKVKITIEYTNKDAHTININGRNETLYTPFVAVCGTIVDNDKNKNIEITNGKIVDDGSKSVLMGMALPRNARKFKYI